MGVAPFAGGRLLRHANYFGTASGIIARLGLLRLLESEAAHLRLGRVKGLKREAVTYRI
jgi:hypothetical protein